MRYWDREQGVDAADFNRSTARVLNGAPGLTSGRILIFAIAGLMKAAKLINERRGCNAAEFSGDLTRPLRHGGL
jgi:hypothetical protein